MHETISDSLPNIGRGMIPSSIVEVFTQSLLSGELKPGDRLPTEMVLSNKMGVGRNSVREAIKMLSSIGVVETRRGSGSYITSSFSSQMLNPLIVSLVFEQGTSQELIQLRLSLDTVAAEIALQTITDDEIACLVKINEELLEVSQHTPQNTTKVLELDIAFHEEIYRLTRNRLLAKIGHAIYSLFHASISKSVVRTQPEQIFESHQAVISALKTKDLALLRRTVEDSIHYWRASLEQSD